MSPAIMSLIILAVCVVLYITEKVPMATVSVLGCAAMVVFGVCKLNVVLGSFAGEIFALLFGMMVVGNALFECGVLDKAGQMIVKLSKNNEHRFLVYVCLFTFTVCWVLNNSSVLILMLTICGELGRSSNIKLKNIAIPMTIAAICGGHCTLIGFATQLAASGMLETASGESFSMFCLAKVALPVGVVTLLYMFFPGYKIGQKIWGNRVLASDVQSSDAAAYKEKELIKGQAIKAVAILAVMILLFVTEWITPGTTALLGAALVICFGVVSEKKAFAKVNWSMIIWMCGSLGLGSAVAAGGGTKLIGEFFMKVLGDLNSPMLLLCIMSFLAMMLSQLMNNATALLVILPATLTVAMELGYRPFPFAYAMTLAAGITFLTPLANGNIALTMVAGHKFMDYVKYGFIPTVVNFILIILLTPIFYPLI